MNLLARTYGSSLGKKYLMAITGLVLFVFVIGHMLGNMQIFLGPAAINSYAHFLKSQPTILWLVRVGLFLVAVVHIVTALQLASENRSARPVGYETGRPTAASFSSRTMVVSGLVLFAFIIYHLLHFTLGVTNPGYLQLRDQLSGYQDVYRMMIMGFSNPFVSAFYLVSMGLLLLHLSHGVGSLFQSLGLRNKKNTDAIIRFARVSAAIIFAGNCSIPIAVFTGLVK
jgi:succinate dehydrogenase / fumarate reductase cytochrome b subunit